MNVFSHIRLTEETDTSSRVTGGKGKLEASIHRNHALHHDWQVWVQKEYFFGRKHLGNEIQNLQKSSKNDLKIGFCTSKVKLNICLGSALYL